MNIRKSDKILVIYLALVGAFASAYVAVLQVITMATDKRDAYREETAYIEEHKILYDLPDHVQDSALGAMIDPKTVLGAAQEEVIRHQVRLAELQNDFWVRSPMWLLISIGLGALLCGGGAGYLACWCILHSLACVMYKCIRILYRLFRITKPDEESPEDMDEYERQAKIRRSSERVLARFIQLLTIILITAIITGLLVMFDFRPFVR
jgi:hypothetical protein